MAGIESLIARSERLTAIFGHWPSIHDAEVIDLRLWRGDVDPDRDRYVFPEVTVRLRVWEWARSVAPPGTLERTNTTLVTLRFHGVEEDFRLAGVNHINSIDGLAISQHERESGPTPYFAVRFAPHSPPDTEMSFKCRWIEVVEAATVPGGGAHEGGR